jgi:phospholipid transport system substrate-binding protein
MVCRAVVSAVLWLVALGHAALASDVTAPIEQLDAALLQAMKAGKAASFQQRYDMLAPAVIRAVDLDYILTAGIGASWATLPADQQAALRAAWQRYSVATYVSNFDDFSGERLDLSAPTGGANPVVRVTIAPGSSGGESHTLGYAMHQTPAGWKAFDVTADGSISEVAAQQDQIRSLFRSGGAGGLLARLQQKTNDLAGGAAR